ncbi:hypothetical protein HKBW3S03_01831, partial [Candidatus Hakubella thermalkaliphila]
SAQDERPVYCCGRALTCRKLLSLVVVEQESNVTFPVDVVYVMFRLPSLAFSDCTLSNLRQFLIGNLCSCCCRDHPAVQAVKCITFQVVREFRGLPNARDKKKLMWGFPQFHQSPFDRFQNGKVSTTGTPGRLSPLKSSKVSPIFPPKVSPGCIRE